jgi:hypothetical protein
MDKIQKSKKFLSNHHKEEHFSKSC